MHLKKFPKEVVFKNEDCKDEMISFNNLLYDEFTICELEERLETKPWICGAHVDCPNLQCGVDSAPAPTEPSPAPQ